MAGRLMGVCAVCVVVLVSGCTLHSALLTWPDGGMPSSTQLMRGDVESVTESSQSSLESGGLRVRVCENEGSSRISGTTKSGRDFELVLTKQVVNGEEQTLVQLQWSGEPEMGFWLEYLEGMTERGFGGERRATDVPAGAAK